MTPGRQSPRRAQPAASNSLLANLAAAPFVNKRPVQRFAVAAWVVGVLLTAVNVLLWVQYRHESTTLRGRLGETRAAIERKSKSVVDMDQQLRGLQLPAQNAQVEFLNARIAERTFPWSLLFERIAGILPDGVRLQSLAPVFDDRRTQPRSQRKKEEAAPRGPEDQVISLKIRGAAKTDDALYQLIDAFFASPAFAQPRLFQESTAAEVEFTVDVDYRPRYTGDASHLPAAAGEAAADEETSAQGEAPVEAQAAGASSGRPAAGRSRMAEVDE
jgi:hypothetical protein